MERYLKGCVGLNTIKFYKELGLKLSPLDEEFIKSLERSLRPSARSLFWEGVHNVRDLVVFLICLPFVPLVWFIKSLRGED